MTTTLTRFQEDMKQIDVLKKKFEGVLKNGIEHLTSQKKSNSYSDDEESSKKKTNQSGDQQTQEQIQQKPLTAAERRMQAKIIQMQQ